MSNIRDQVVALLTPVIGTGLATSAVTMQCRKMGIFPEDLSEDNIIDFSDRFEKTLQIFAGQDIASSLIQKIKSLK